MIQPKVRPARSGSVPDPHRSREHISHGELAGLLNSYIARDARSLNAIAQASLVDVAYLWRLRAGHKRNPSRDVLIRLGLAMRLEPEEVDPLLVAADYAPITLRQI